MIIKGGGKHKADFLEHPSSPSEEGYEEGGMEGKWEEGEEVESHGFEDGDADDDDDDLGPPPTSPPRPPNLLLSFLNLIANDPGRVRISSLARCVEVYLKEGGDPVLAMRFKQYTLAQWRCNTHAERRLARSKLWCAPMEAHLTRLASVTKKTASMGTLAAFLRVYVEVQGPILEEKLKGRWKRECFRSWRAAKVAADRWWMEGYSGDLEDNNYKRKAAMVYGGANFSAASPGLHPTPTTSFYASSAHIAKVTASHLGVVDEFRTSRKCGCCGETMSQVRTTQLTPRQQAKNERSLEKWGRVNPHVADIQTLRGLYQCTNPACPNNGRRLKDRDNAAASNMVQLGAASLVGMPRPSYLERGGGPS